MPELSSTHDFSESFTIELASALIAGIAPRVHPRGSPNIVQRMQEDANKGLLTVVEGRVTRAEISRWLVALGLGSEYQFDLSVPVADVAQTPVLENDPIDLPIELDVANIAHRAVLNGFGDQSKTFRSRLVQYIKETYPNFKSEVVDRIATVANPDKSPGRKSRDKE